MRLGTVMRYYFLLFVVPAFLFSNDRFSCYKDFDYHQQQIQIQGIDDLFLINLDKRTEKLKASEDQFSCHGLSFYRFSAVNGSLLGDEIITKAGLVFEDTMKCIRAKKDPRSKQKLELSTKNAKDVVFHKHLSAGALGCYLSHISILKKAYDLGLDRIWVFEDDVVFLKNPKEIEKRMRELDELTPEYGWDVLVTDDLKYSKSKDDRSLLRPDREDISHEIMFSLSGIRQNFRGLKSEKNLEKNLEQIYLMKKARNNIFFFAFPDAYNNFRRISGWSGTHSMIINRTGMKKILDFFEKRGIFFPYDVELAYIPFLRMYNLKDPITAMHTEVSDTIEKE